MHAHQFLVVTGGVVALAGALVSAQTPASEDVARRQLESGRSFARQGNYTEALKDFRAVADTHGSTSVADNALLEIARYYFSVAGDFKEAAGAVDAILKKYPTSDSAPDAYLMAGRLALARSRQSADLKEALANFDRVYRLFPASDAVPASLYYSADSHYHAREFSEAIGHLGRVTAEYPSSPAAADAYVAMGRVLLALGEPILAMEELQQARNRWPNTPAAAHALARNTLLHRLYVRGRGGQPFALSSETAGPAKLQNVVALATTGRGAVYWASESGVGAAAPATADRPPTAARPRGLVIDTTGNLLVIDGAALRPVSGTAISIALPQPNGVPKPLDRIDAAVQLSNGDWLVMDGGERTIHRFGRAGGLAGAFAPIRVTRLAVNVMDDVAGIDRDQKAIAIFDGAGKPIGRIPFRGAGYELQNPEDLTFDTFGHLYVLDRGAIAVFSPFPAAPAASAATPPAAAAPAATGGYRLVTFFSVPEKDPSGFRRATSFALDSSGGVFLYDERAARILVYR